MQLHARHKAEINSRPRGCPLPDGYDENWRPKERAHAARTGGDTEDEEYEEGEAAGGHLALAGTAQPGPGMTEAEMNANHDRRVVAMEKKAEKRPVRGASRSGGSRSSHGHGGVRSDRTRSTSAHAGRAEARAKERKNEQADERKWNEERERKRADDKRSRDSRPSDRYEQAARSPKKDWARSPKNSAGASGSKGPTDRLRQAQANVVKDAANAAAHDADARSPPLKARKVRERTFTRTKRVKRGRFRTAEAVNVSKSFNNSCMAFFEGNKSPKSKKWDTPEGAWIVDSGCTRHISPFISDFTSLHKYVRTPIYGIGPTPLWSKQTGGVSISCDTENKEIKSFEMTDVLLCESMEMRLFSTTCARKEGASFEFFPHPKTGEIGGVMRLKHGTEIPLVQHKEMLLIMPIAHAYDSYAMAAAFPAQIVTDDTANKENGHDLSKPFSATFYGLRLLHARLGHASQRRTLKTADAAFDTPTIAKGERLDACDACQDGNATHASSPKSKTDPKERKENQRLIFSDWWGKFNSKGCHGEHYIQCFIDDDSGYAICNHVCLQVYEPRSQEHRERA